MLALSNFSHFVIDESLIEDLTIHIEESNHYRLPLWVKLSATISYILGLFGAFILLSFVAYEKNGLASPYRMVSNQLLSLFYLNVIFNAIICRGIDLVGIWIGFLPQRICQANITIKNGFLPITSFMFLVMISFVRFMFVVVWKRMKILNDDFLAKFGAFWVWLMGILVCSVSILGPGEEPNLVKICQGIKPLPKVNRNFVGMIVMLILAFMQGFFQLMIWMKRCQIRFQEQNGHKSLESLLINAIITAFCLLAMWLFYQFNRYENINICMYNLN